MSRTHFSGPLTTGEKHAGQAGGPNWGYVVLTQSITLTQNGANAVSGAINLPAGVQLIDFRPDVTTAFDSATSATLTVGVAAAGTDYVSGVNAKTAGRASPSYSAAQLAAMLNTGTNTVLTATVTPVGATTAGSVTVTVTYAQKANND